MPIASTSTLELGAATGALSIFLKLKGVNVLTRSQLFVTKNCLLIFSFFSDYDDGGQIENCILQNMSQNGLFHRFIAIFIV